MKIAYVINSVEGGGAALPVPAVVRELERNGAEVALFALTPRDRRSVPAIEAAGIPLAIRSGGDRDHIAAVRWLSGRIGDWSPDLIWTSLTRATLLGQLVGRRHRIPVVSWQHNAFLKPANRRLLRMTRSLSDLWIADSHSVAELTATRLGIARDRLITWPLFAADPSAPQTRAWQRGQTLRIGSLGRLNPRKGYDLLIEALAALKRDGFVPPVPFEIEIAGEGAAKQELTAMAAQRGVDTIRFVGFHERPQAFLATLHLYAQPSRAEGLCIAAHEAMQAGVPTIVSAVGEMPHSVIDGRTGRVVAPGDVDALARVLRDLLSHPDQLAGMGWAARAHVLDRFGAASFARAGAAIVARLPRKR